MSQNNFFISHSSKDSILVNKIVEFLQLTLKVDRSTIYCTSGKGTKNIGTGENFIDNIKANVIGTKMVIFIFTPNYFKSKFCLAELGAAWVLNSKIFPIIIPPFDRELIGETPLGTATQTLTLDTYQDLVKMVGEFKRQGIADYDDPAYVNQCAEELITWIKANCSFPDEKTYTKKEYSILQEKIAELDTLNREQLIEIKRLEKNEKDILALKDPEAAKEYVKQTSDSFEQFEKIANEVRGALSALDTLVISSIYHDVYFRERLGYTPVNFDRLDWEATVNLEANKSIIREENTFYPNYSERKTKQAVSKLKELEVFISEADEPLFDTFEEEYDFNLDMTIKQFWEKVFGVTIFM